MVHIYIVGESELPLKVTIRDRMLSVIISYTENMFSLIYYTQNLTQETIILFHSHI